MPTERQKKILTPRFTFKPYGAATFERYDKQILLLPLGRIPPLGISSVAVQRFMGSMIFLFSWQKRIKFLEKKFLLAPPFVMMKHFLELMRQREEANGAELFVNMTNDNYYPESSLHEQHHFTPAFKSCRKRHSSRPCMQFRHHGCRRPFRTHSRYV